MISSCELSVACAVPNAVSSVRNWSDRTSVCCAVWSRRQVHNTKIVVTPGLQAVHTMAGKCLKCDLRSAQHVCTKRHPPYIDFRHHDAHGAEVAFLVQRPALHFLAAVLRKPHWTMRCQAVATSGALQIDDAYFSTTYCTTYCMIGFHRGVTLKCAITYICFKRYRRCP